MSKLKVSKTKNKFINSKTICMFITFISLMVMLVFAGEHSLLHDDIFTIDLSRKGRCFESTMNILSNEARSVPPLFYFVSMIWMRIVPYGMVWLKIPSIIFVAIGVYFCGKSARKIAGDNAAIFTTLIAGFSFPLIRTGAYAFRMYGLLFMLVSLFIWFYIKRMKNIGKERTRDIVIYGIIMTLLVYTHYFGILVASCFFLGDLYLCFRKKIKWNCFISYCIAIIAFMPFFTFALIEIIHRNAIWWELTPTLSIAYDFIYLFFNRSFLLILAFILTCLIVIKKRYYLFFEKKGQQLNSGVILQLIFTSLFIFWFIYVYSRFIHPEGSIFTFRYFISIFPMIFIISAIGLNLLISIITLKLSSKFKQASKVFLIVTISIVLGYHGIVSILKYDSKGLIQEYPYIDAIEWIYKQPEAHYDESILLANSGKVHGIEYFVTHDGRRNPINIMAAWDFGFKYIEKWNRLYMIDDGIAETPDFVNRVLERYYDLTIVNIAKNGKVLIYERLPEVEN